MQSMNELLDAIPGIHARAKKRSAKAPESAPAASNVVQLPLWPHAMRAVPNGMLRSALFGAIRKGRRKYLQAEPLASVDGVEVRYTGQRLDQGDLDVYESVLHALREQPLGTKCRVTSYELLKLMGKTDTGKNRAILETRLERLRANAVRMTQGRYTYIGGLVDAAYRDDQTQEWVIVLNPELRALYGPDQFTMVEWSVRHALNGQQLAQWLHGFYASHAKPYPMKVETLLKLSGSEASETWKFAQTLRKALDAVAEASAAHGQRFSYTIAGDLVEVNKPASASQRRHLAGKPAKVRSPR